MTYKTLAEIQANNYVGQRTNLDIKKVIEWDKCFKHWYYMLKRYSIETAEKIVFKEIEK